jgi:hypothetical protein
MNAPLDHSRIPEPWVDSEPVTKPHRWLLYPLSLPLVRPG